MKEKLVQIVVVILFCVLLIWKPWSSSNKPPSKYIETSSSPATSSPRASSTDKLSIDLQPDVEYIWFADQSCNPRSSKQVCISKQDYKALCLASDGVSKQGAGTLAITNTRAWHLLENAQTNELSVKWQEGEKYGCRMTLEVSGIYKGSSARDRLEGGITSFIVNQNGKLLAHHASELN